MNYQVRTFYITLLCIAPFFVTAQYKNDNVLYKTVYAENLCDSLNHYPDRLILDVRSAAEFNDEQMKGMSGMNLGHFSEAKNIDINDLKNHLNELSAYKNRAVFVICSHSQRSRRASSFLAKNGFINVLNINGGMTSLYQLPKAGYECIKNQIHSNVQYQLLSPIELCQDLTNKNNIKVIDVRSDSVFDHLNLSSKENAYGTFLNSIHLPFEKLQNNIGSIDTTSEIVITDIDGSLSEPAADLLLKNHFHHVSILSGGLERFVATGSNLLPCKALYYKSNIPYHIIGSAELSEVYPSLVNPVFIDLRSVPEFNNLHKESWRNMGNIEGAINIPFEQLVSKLPLLNSYKDKPVLLYSVSNNPETYSAAELLTSRGFKNVYVLSQGLFNIRWTANNIKGYSNLSKLVVNIPEENL